MHYRETSLAGEFGLGFETWDAEQSEWADEFGELGQDEWECPFSEAELDELAMELLSVSSEAELDQFLGKLVKKAWGGIKKVGAAVAPVLKGVAKVGLPILGKVAGTAFGGPLGGMLGGQLGSLVSSALEMETEGLSAEDREFEMARNFVKLAGMTARRAAMESPGGNGKMGSAHIKRMLAQAAQHSTKVGDIFGRANWNEDDRQYWQRREAAAERRRHLERQIAEQKERVAARENRQGQNREADLSPGKANSGRWLRRGDKIVLFGAG